MIGRTNCGAGGSRAIVVSLHGACSATVSITGATTASLLLDASGNGSIILEEGNYTFTDSVSEYSVQQAITESTDVNLWPAGKTMLYWYGREFEELTGGWSSAGVQSQAAYPAGGTATKLTNSMTIRAASSKSCGFATNNPVAAGSQITFRGKTSSNYLYYGVSTDKSSLQSTRVTATENSFTSSATVVDTVISFASNESGYPAFFNYGGTYLGTVFASWIE